MFTGIVQTIGVVDHRRETKSGITFAVSAQNFCEALRPGDSVAVNGVCHTVERCDADSFEVTSVPETLRKTTMGDLSDGHAVNLEQAATPDTMLGGHIVQGHVDGVGTVQDLTDIGGERMLTIVAPEEVYDASIDRGSITIDGVSLTVAARLPGNRIRVAIVPYTLSHTVVGAYVAGQRVNIEGDVFGKYVRQYLERLSEAASPDADV